MVSAYADAVAQAPLTEPLEIGSVRFANRVLLAPLAGIGNWFVRLQAHRHGAGGAFSEMVSSFAIHHRNERTLTELLRVHPDEGPLALQLFGQDPAVMRSAAAHVAAHMPQVAIIDLNMGCPVPKVCRTGAGAALLKDPDTAVAVARAAAEGSGLPVTVKLRSGSSPSDTSSGIELARRLVAEAGVAAITFHPRSAKVQHKGVPDYELAARLVETLPVPVILTGGLRTAAATRRAYEQTGAAAVMLARGSLGNPWLFAELLGREPVPSRDAIVAEWLWVVDRAVEHLGEGRAVHYLRKFHPWYAGRIGGGKALHQELQQAGSIAQTRALIGVLATRVAA